VKTIAGTVLPAPPPGYDGKTLHLQAIFVSVSIIHQNVPLETMLSTSWAPAFVAQASLPMT